MSALTPFDITAPLPTGTTLLEASAGTGKTWTIGALVTRYVAEGVATLDQLLVVTFGRAASQELRERVRTQLVEAEHALGGDETLAALVTPSALIDLLLDADHDERALRHRRITEALTQFDAATIATTHQFCSMVLDSLGVAGDTDSQSRLVENLDDRVAEVVDDLYLRAFAQADAAPVFKRAEALKIAQAAVGDPQARIEPTGVDRRDPAGRRVAYAEAVRTELDRRKRRLGQLSYDDLLSQLAGALAGPDDAARQRMRSRWKIVLVDEFQDTDPVQWQVLDRAFTGHATMVLIGDPKQAIYAFRGGDVTTYLKAAETATTQQTLGTNWRSDRPLLDSFQTLLRGAALGDPRIVVHDVEAHVPTSRLTGLDPDQAAPFRLRVVRRDQFARTPNGMLTVGQVRPHIAEDLAKDIRRLLTSAAKFDGRPVQPSDIAVICYRHADLAAAREELEKVRVPAVIAGGGSVFATPAAIEWLTLLEALEMPHRGNRVRAAALTHFFGCSAAELDQRGDALTDEVADRLRNWAEVNGQRGVAAIVEAASALGLPARVLSQVGGERRLTDLRHIGEVLHEVAQTEQLGLVSMLAWLRSQVTEAREGRGTERTRRLDSDAAAVQLVTIHASKGLEYPIVYLPAIGDRFVGKPDRPLFHDDAGQRCLNLGAGGPGWSDHVARATTEEAGEWLRLLYVAITRAKSQVVCWWAPTKNAVHSPLHRMLARAPDAAEVLVGPPVRDDDAIAALLTEWRDVGGPTPQVANIADAGAAPVLAAPSGLAVRSFTRDVDVTWRRTSYSALSHLDSAAAAAAVSVGSEAEVTPKDDEDVDVEAAAAAVLPEGDVPSPMAGLPVGATFGSLVHAVLEHVDPDAADLRAELLAQIEEQRSWWVVDVDAEELADALLAVLDSPLGPLAGGATLRTIALRDRLCELDFELPLAGGDLGTGPVATLGDLVPILMRHLPEGDPVRSYADQLRNPELAGQSLRGYLTGSVDVVLRVPTPSLVEPVETTHRYLIVDYKTNWLGPRDRPLTAHSYAPAALDAAMAHSDYPLQALLYATVLHRFLRWRQPGYDPERHLGGVLYLYLRGMCGPETPNVDGAPCGVFAWQPPVALVEAVSDLLDGRLT